VQGLIFRQHDKEYIFPVFKFQKYEHAESMWRNGNTHLTKIDEFRNGSYGGKNDDPREGQVSLSYPYDPKANYNISLKHEEISIDDVYIYCASRDFLSDTLKLAIKDGKESCVLITDVEEFAHRVANISDDLDFVGVRNCIYSGRDIQDGIFQWGGLAASIRESPILSAWVKPVDYEPQREIRFIWKPKGSLIDESHFNRDIDLSNLLIPIKYGGIEKLFEASGAHTIVTTIVTSSDGDNPFFEINYPTEVFTPVIHKSGSDDDYLLGFLSPSNTISGGRFNGGQIGICATNIGVIGCSVYLKDIERIEYSVKA
jgi:hypothetical protein